MKFKKDVCLTSTSANYKCFCAKITYEKSSRRAKFIQHARSKKKKDEGICYLRQQSHVLFEGAKVADVAFGDIWGRGTSIDIAGGANIVGFFL